jgi:hypothetical protein
MHGKREVRSVNPTQTAKFRFGPVRQETGSKHVRQGDLLEAINVRQTAKAGVYAKRKAFQRTAQTFVGGSLSGTPETVLPGQSGNSLMRDTGDQLWARSNTANAWSLMGTHPRPWVDITTVQSNLYTNPQPFSCLVGSSLWAFALTTNAYEFSIIDITSGVVTGSKVTITATGIVHASAAYDGTNVWVFWVDNGANGTVRCHKIVAATPTVAPAATSYYTFPASPTDVSTVALQQVQARYFSAIGTVAVVACGGSFTGGPVYKRACMHSYLNPATGLAVVAGGNAAKVTIAYSGASGSAIISGLYILDGQDGSGTYWHYVVFGNDSTPTTTGGHKFKVTTASITTVVDNAFSANAGLNVNVNASGYSDPSSDAQYIFSTAIASSGYLGTRTVLYQFVSGTETDSGAFTATDYHSDWMATGFFQYGGAWYGVTGYDDYASRPDYFGSETFSYQRCFHLRKFVPGANAAAGKFDVIAQMIPGNAPAVFNAVSGVQTFPTVTPNATGVSPLWVSGTTIAGACSVVSGSLSYLDLATFKVSMSKVYGKSVQAMGRGFSPGNIPITWNGQCPAHEIAPLLAPSYAYQFGAGTGSDFSILACCYAIYDNDGTIWRSSPLVVSATIGHGAVYNFPACTAHLAGTPVFLEIYIGNNATPKLQVSLPVSVSVYGMYTWTTPTAATMANGEILYTTGNALSQTWPQACQAMGVWNNRLFLGQKNVLWTSKELEPGFGPLFNEVQTSPWNEERNDITAIGPVDWNYLGLASADQVAVVSGPGPDGVGNGNYVIKTLPSWTGVAAGGVAIQGAQGLYYQNKGTGRIMCLQPSLQVMEAAGGAYDYASYAFTVAAWYESENLMVFFAPASGAAVVIDYQHPQDVAPFGQVYLWTFAAGFVPAAACRDDVGLLVISSQGGVYRTTASQWVDDNNSGTTDPYQMKLATAELQLSDLQGEFDLKTVQVLLAMRGASSIFLAVFPGYASATAYDARVTAKAINLPDPTNSGDTETVMTKPAKCMRIQSFRVVIIESVGTATQSFEFEGLGVEFSTQGRLLRPASTRVI